MSVELGIARAATAVNALILVGLLYVWGMNYREYRAQHTLGLLVFAGLLFLENLLAFYLYNVHPVFGQWLAAAAPVAKSGMMIITVLELLGLAFLAKITWT